MTGNTYVGRKLRDLYLLPIQCFFILTDLIIFHNIFHDCYFINLPLYARPYNDDRGRLRSLVAPPYYYNSQRTTLDLGYRDHVLWNHLPIRIREELVPSKFKILVCTHLRNLRCAFLDIYYIVYYLKYHLM